MEREDVERQKDDDRERERKRKRKDGIAGLREKLVGSLPKRRDVCAPERLKFGAAANSILSSAVRRPDPRAGSSRPVKPLSHNHSGDTTARPARLVR